MYKCCAGDVMLNVAILCVIFPRDCVYIALNIVFDILLVIPIFPRTNYKAHISNKPFKTIWLLITSRSMLWFRIGTC